MIKHNTWKFGCYTTPTLIISTINCFNFVFIHTQPILTSSSQSSLINMTSLHLTTTFLNVCDDQAHKGSPISVHTIRSSTIKFFFETNLNSLKYYLLSSYWINFLQAHYDIEFNLDDCNLPIPFTSYPYVFYIHRFREICHKYQLWHRFHFLSISIYYSVLVYYKHPQ